MTATTVIGSVVSKVETWNPKQKAPEEEINYIDIASVDKEAKSICGVSTLFGKDAPSRARQIVQVGDVLVSTVRPNLNAVAFVPDEYDGATASTGYCVLRPEPSKCDGRFLFHWVKTNTFIEEMVKLATGANYPAVSDRIVKGAKIPLPLLPEQRRIAAILDKADVISRKRQQAIRLTEEFLRSVFLDMFGDPVLNPKGWEVKNFGDVCNCRLGKMLDKKQQTGKHLKKYLRNTNVKWGHFDLSDLFEMDFNEKDQAEFELKNGDILICEGGEVGRSSVWHEDLSECYFQKALHRARPHENIITSEYLSNLMWFLAKYGGLKDHTTSATIAHLTGIKLKGMDIPVPPLNLQKRFDALVIKIKATNDLLTTRKPSVDNLFNSLVQRAFRGEL